MQILYSYIRYTDRLLDVFFLFLAVILSDLHEKNEEGKIELKEKEYTEEFVWEASLFWLHVLIPMPFLSLFCLLRRPSHVTYLLNGPYKNPEQYWSIAILEYLKYEMTSSFNLIIISAWKVSKYEVFSGPCFSVFGLNTDRYSVSLRIQFQWEKIQTRKNSVFEHFSSRMFLQWNFHTQYILSQNIAEPNGDILYGDIISEQLKTWKIYCGLILTVWHL